MSRTAHQRCIGIDEGEGRPLDGAADVDALDPTGRSDGEDRMIEFGRNGGTVEDDHVDVLVDGAGHRRDAGEGHRGTGGQSRIEEWVGRSDDEDFQFRATSDRGHGTIVEVENVLALQEGLDLRAEWKLECLVGHGAGGQGDQSLVDGAAVDVDAQILRGLGAAEVGNRDPGDQTTGCRLDRELGDAAIGR